MDSRLNLSKLASGESELSDRLPMLSSSLSKNGIMGFEEMMNNSFSTIQVSLTPSRLDQVSDIPRLF